MAGIKGIAFLVILIAIVVRLYLRYQELSQLMRNKINVLKPPHCVAVSQPMPGPEDMTFSNLRRVLFVSSHGRRDMSSVGVIFRSFVDDIYANGAPKYEFAQLSSNYPVDFRPHGLTIYEDKSIVRVYAISHPGNAQHRNTIEVFNYILSDDRSKEIFAHVRTIANVEMLSSPNDLFAIGFDDLLVSNDHRHWNIKMMELLDDIPKKRLANVVHYHTAATAKSYTSTSFDSSIVAAADVKKEHWEELDSLASFGNGIIAVTDPFSHQEYVYRASAADYTLFKYELLRSLSADKSYSVKLRYVSEVKLPISPDNLEYDAATHSLIITGHVSTYLFMLHAITQLNVSPSSSLRYGLGNSDPAHFIPEGTLEPLFLDPTGGQQMSASSEGLLVRDNRGNHDRAVLYLGQVFNPTVLACEIK